jgi:hypothetical protein
MEFSIATGDIKHFEVDLIAVKYSEDFWKVDADVTALIKAASRSPDVDEYAYVATSGRVVARAALFVGVPPAGVFSYEHARRFATRVLEVLAVEAPDVHSVAMTVSGVSADMDEVETALALFGGILDSLHAGQLPRRLERVTIVDKDPRRVACLRKVFDGSLKFISFASRVATEEWAYHLESGPGAEASSHTAKRNTERCEAAEAAIGKAGATFKPHVFVAMPFKEEMEDVFFYGIQRSVRAIHYVCERIDQESFTGDILERLKVRIEKSALVIADLTDDDANVFLEVGYAWGKGRPTLFLARGEAALKFDVRNHRCIRYRVIHELEKTLTRQLRDLKLNGDI